MFGEYADIVNLVDKNSLDVRKSDPKSIDSLVSLADNEDLEFEISCGCVDVKTSRNRVATVQKASLSDALLYDNSEPTVLIAGQPPFYVEAVTKSWTSLYGWESDQILGHNMNFLKGDGAKIIDIALLYSVVYTESTRSSTVRGYAKDGTQFSANITLSPIYDITASGSMLTKHLSNISIRFSEFQSYNGFLSSDLDEDYMGERQDGIFR